MIMFTMAPCESCAALTREVGELKKENADMKSGRYERGQVWNELQEQARINSMGAERELGLRAEVEKLRKAMLMACVDRQDFTCNQRIDLLRDALKP